VTRRIKELELQVQRLLEEKDAAPPPSPLTDQERAELATKWAQVACIFCGGWHGGLCNRVRRVELDEQGRPRKTVFWDKWEQNPRTIWPEDVWVTKSAMVQDLETQSRERANQLEIQRTAAREVQRQQQESQRRETPAEIAARALGRGGQ